MWLLTVVRRACRVIVKLGWLFSMKDSAVVANGVLGKHSRRLADSPAPRVLAPHVLGFSAQNIIYS